MSTVRFPIPKLNLVYKSCLVQRILWFVTARWDGTRCGISRSTRRTTWRTSPAGRRRARTSWWRTPTSRTCTARPCPWRLRRSRVEAPRYFQFLGKRDGTKISIQPRTNPCIPYKLITFHNFSLSFFVCTLVQGISGQCQTKHNWYLCRKFYNVHIISAFSCFSLWGGCSLLTKWKKSNNNSDTWQTQGRCHLKMSLLNPKELSLTSYR